MKRFYRNIALFLLPVLAGIILLFMLPLNKDFSYHFVKGECENKASWIYKRIFDQKENIDIAFSGASQTSCAIMDEYIEKEINKEGIRNIHVANLGYCRRGRDIQYAMLKELFKHKNPKIVVIEVAEDEPKKSHPVFPYLAESEDLFGSFVLYNQRFFTNIWKGLTVRLEQLKFEIFGDKNPDEFKSTNVYGYWPSKQIASPEVLKQNELDWTKRLAKPKSEMLQTAELNYSKHYIEKIVKLAQQNNCRLIFLYLPESGSTMKEPFLAEYYKSIGELITLPDSILSNKSNWKDGMHFNDSGALETSDFLVGILSNFID